MAARTLTVAAAALALLLLPQAALAKRGDRNHDRIPDRWERHFHLSLTKNQARRDPDHDGLNNKREFGAHTNPRKADTDGDRLDDGDEVASANDPRDPDTDGDGTEDGDENGGWVGAFDGTTLTLKLFKGGEVSGVVDGSTEIECGSGDDSGNGNDASDDGHDRVVAAQDGDGPVAEDPADDAGGDDSPGADPADGDTGDHSPGGSPNCTAADLKPGTVVHEAELAVSGDGAIFSLVDLVDSHD